MSVLSRFSVPAGLAELSDADRTAWSTNLSETVGRFADQFPQFYDPLREDTPPTAQTVNIVWVAFPARLLRGATSEEQRWRRADSSRDEQDEYCEWSVERANDKVTRITFTSEVREYWEHVADRDPERLLVLYRELVAADVSRQEVISAGRYNPRNDRNTSVTGRLAHLVQRNNNLTAAYDLAAQATILRQRNGQPVTSKQALVSCGRLGDPFRNSDPQIAAAVNDAAATGSEVTLADPPGLYIDGLITAGIVAPDGADPATFWTVERGTPARTLRASFSVPKDLGYAVGDLMIGGRPIRFGAQIADRVRVRLTATVKPGAHQPRRLPCA